MVGSIRNGLDVYAGLCSLIDRVPFALTNSHDRDCNGTVFDTINEPIAGASEFNFVVVWHAMQAV